MSLSQLEFTEQRPAPYLLDHTSHVYQGSVPLLGGEGNKDEGITQPTSPSVALWCSVSLEVLVSCRRPQRGQANSAPPSAGLTCLTRYTVCAPAPTTGLYTCHSCQSTAHFHLRTPDPVAHPLHLRAADSCRHGNRDNVTTVLMSEPLPRCL